MPLTGWSCRFNFNLWVARARKRTERIMRFSSTPIAVLILVGFAAWYGWTHHELQIRQTLGLAPVPKVRVLPAQFKCDGRIFCSQMTSCEEARFFLQYCPGTKLDRDGAGIDCEKQWCGTDFYRPGRLQHLTQ
jgi:hypothetical protein